jgi:hypothetical protein
VTREQEDPESLADELEDEAERLEQRSKELGEDISDVKQDWERKRSDQGVPGANPPDGEDETSGQGEDVPPEREAGEAQADQSG